MAHVYNNPGIVGRVVPGPLTVRIATGSVKTRAVSVALEGKGDRARRIALHR